MLNRLTNVFAESREASDETSWGIDARPALRLTCLALLILLPMFAIAARVAFLQTSTADRFAKPFKQTFVRYESVPSQDGRLLSADGRVLATDRRQFTVEAHYRWLEDPADSAWLKSQALSRLSRSERRNSALISQTQKDILAERKAMWRRLAELTGRSVDELEKRRTEIQNRVEGIVDLVERNRRRKANSPKSRRPSSDEPLWRKAWQRFSQSITTPSDGKRLDPLIIKEEQDYHPLITGITLHAVAEIESHPELYPGLKIETRSWRDYPQDELAAHLVGVRKPLTAEEAEERAERFSGRDPLAYEVGDRLGRMGLEKRYDDLLHGLRGRRRIVRNRRGEIVQSEIIREARGGADLVLTLHANLQERLERLVDENLAKKETGEAEKTATAGASLVVLDVRTGAVVAAVSAPRFSLQELLHPTPKQWEVLTSDPRRPFFHRATRMALPPGSVFKVVTAVALLESGRFDPDRFRHCRGYLDQPDRHRCYIYRHYGVGHGDLNLSQAICRSCNVYFFQGARKIGPGSLVHWAERFGIGQSTGIDLPGEPSGNLPQPPASQRRSGIVEANFEVADRSESPWYPGDTLGLAIGQSRLTVTPMQMARVMAAIANDGNLVTPHLLRRQGPMAQADEAPSQPITPPEPRPIPGLTEGTLARIREGLEMVVAHHQGTGYDTVRLPDVKIAGKTGTAEVGGGRPDHAWFAGYVPAERPKFAFAVVLEHAGSGGKNAGPVARQAVETLLELRLITGEEVETGESGS